MRRIVAAGAVLLVFAGAGLWAAAAWRSRTSSELRARAEWAALAGATHDGRLAPAARAALLREPDLSLAQATSGDGRVLWSIEGQAESWRRACSSGRFGCAGEVTGVAEVQTAARGRRGSKRRTVAVRVALSKRPRVPPEVLACCAALAAAFLVALAPRERPARPAAGPRPSGPFARAEKLAILGRITSHLAHELNNPLTVIAGTAQLLRNRPELAGCAEPQDDLLRIMKAARRCESSVWDLMTVTIGAGKDGERVDVSEAVTNAAAAETGACAGAGVELRCEVPDLPALAFAEKLAFSRGIRAMVANAREAISDERKSGRIVVRVRHGERKVRVEVEDDGPGIPPSILPYLFEPFVSGKSYSRGNGLELAAFRIALERRGGSIQAENRPSGGAKFIIDLPAVPGGTPRRILIVDDEPAFAASLESFLLARGHSVDVAADGVEGTRKARAGAYDLVLCDLLMPGRGGLETLGEAARSVPVDRWVFVTGASDGDLLSRARATGRPLLKKPVAFRDIEALLT